MLIDIVCVVIILIFCFLGWRSGILRQLLLVGCIVGSYFASIFVVGYVNPIVSRWGFKPSNSYAVAWFGCWLIVYIALRIIVHWIDRILGYDRRGKPKAWNRRAGAVLGLAKGFLIAAIFVCVLDAVIASPPSFLKNSDLFARLVNRYDVSYSKRIISVWNPLKEWRLVDKATVLLRVSARPDALQDLEKDPEIRKLLRHPRVKAVTGSKKLREAWRRGDFIAILTDENFRAMVKDPEVKQLLADVRIFDAMERQLKKTEK